jgi:NTE family protein
MMDGAAASSQLGDTGQIVLVFQGGGALGAYQAGVYQALHEAGVEPDWIVGTSIGAINASLIAGNAPQDRLSRLEEFWRLMTLKSFWSHGGMWPQLSQSLAYYQTLMGGLPNFFSPNPLAFASRQLPLGPENAGFYSTKPLERTLLSLVDFDLIKSCRPRLTVGAAQLRNSRMRYFDSRDTEINVRHIMASGALPPAFPPVRIDGELYWDGGILSNTPAEVVFDDDPRRNSLIFAVHLWNPAGPEPQTIADVMHRHKDIQYSSRVSGHIARQLHSHRLRHVIKQLAAQIPGPARNSPLVKELESWGCLTRMHVVRLIAPMVEHEDQSKDVDFSKNGIRRRWEAGYADAMAALEKAPWKGAFDPLEGVILHEFESQSSVSGNCFRSAETATGLSEGLSPQSPTRD